MVSADLPDGLESIGEYAFYGSGLKSIVIPDTVTELGERAFYACTNAKTLKLSSNLKVIPDGAFGFCEKLKTIEIPNGVTTLDTSFPSCTDLKKVTIPASVNYMRYTFGECFGLDEVTFKGDFPGTFSGVFYACNLTARYPYGNDTWTDDAIDSGYGRKEISRTTKTITKLPKKANPLTIKAKTATVTVTVK